MFAKIIEGKVITFPYHLSDLYKDNPNTSFPKEIPDSTKAEFGMFPVTEKPAPVYNPITQYVEYKHEPVLQEGAWVLLPLIKDFSAEQMESFLEEKKRQVRTQRNYLLAETDWMALSDVTMSPAVATYRQVLRDITEQVGFPDNVIWPTKP
jgi:hypothetical protein